jgi:hypothetical protein
MLAALLVLALGGGFGQVGVLGQIFAGPPAPSVGGGATWGGRGAPAAPSLPVISAVALRPSTAATTHRATRVAPVAAGSRRSGGALAPAGGPTPIVTTGRPTPARPAPTSSAPTRSAPSHPTAQPGQSAEPTVVDRVIKVVTPIAQQLPAPAGPALTQAVQAAGSAADSVLPPVKLP